MLKTDEDQKVLFAIYGRGGWAITAQGEAARIDIQDYQHTDDLFGCSSQSVPKTPGLYVWEGEITVDDGQNGGGEPSDWDIDWQGKFRPARVADLAAFGMTDPDRLIVGPPDE